jgi:hypothetical protein
LYRSFMWSLFFLFPPYQNFQMGRSALRIRSLKAVTDLTNQKCYAVPTFPKLFHT